MQRIALLTLLMGFLSFNLSAQKIDTPEWDVSYVGNNLWNPGLQFGRLIPGLGRHEGPVIYQAHLGAYWDPQAQFNLYAFAGWQYRGSFSKRDYFDIRISPVGLLRSFYPEAYRVLDNGNTDKIFLPGRWYYAPEFSLTWGFRPKNEQIKQVYFGPQLFLLLPYNSRILPILNFQIGLNLKSN
ncbi:MAG: hypothetical protein AAF927_07980 [Bacteroidota bacterium]